MLKVLALYVVGGFLLLPGGLAGTASSTQANITLATADFPLEDLLKIASDHLGYKFAISQTSAKCLYEKLQVSAPTSFSQEEFTVFLHRTLQQFGYAIVPLEKVRENVFQLYDIQSKDVVELV